MTKRFRKFLSILCTLALLAACIGTAFATEEPPVGTPDEEVTDVVTGEEPGTDPEDGDDMPEDIPGETPEAGNNLDESGDDDGPAEIPEGNLQLDGNGEEAGVEGTGGEEGENNTPSDTEPVQQEVVSDPVTIGDAVEQADNPEEGETPAQNEPTEDDTPADVTPPADQTGGQDDDSQEEAENPPAENEPEVEPQEGESQEGGQQEGKEDDQQEAGQQEDQEDGQQDDPEGNPQDEQENGPESEPEQDPVIVPEQEDDSDSEPEEDPVIEPEQDEQEEEQSDESGNESGDESEDEPGEEPDGTEDLIVLKLGVRAQVSSILTREHPYTLKAVDDYSRIVIFTLIVPSEDAVSVTVNNTPVTLNKTENEDPEKTDVTYTFEYPLLQGEDYIVTLTAEQDGYIPFDLSIEKKPDEKSEEETQETPEESTGAGEEDEETDSGLDDGNPVEEDEAEDPERELSADISVTWDDENPTYGSTAHFSAYLIGYDGLDYTVQWQLSKDNVNWENIEGATEETMDIVYTQENGSYYWRIVVDISEPTA